MSYEATMTQPRTKGWWPLAVGVVCMLLLAPASFGIGIWLGVHRGTEVLKDGSWTASAPKQLQANTPYVLLATPETTDALTPGAPCGAVDPTGAPIPFAGRSSTTTINGLSTRWTFTTRAAGSYRLDCNSASFRIATQEKMDGLGKAIGIPVIAGIGGGILLGLLGLGLVIFAIVRLVSTSGQRRQWAQNQQPPAARPW